MNENIKLLALQAGFVYVQDERIGWAGNYDASLEKFAELIVRACAIIIDDIPSSPQGSWSDGYYEGCRDSANVIRQHFGVKP